jgi:hypothetical protein
MRQQDQVKLDKRIEQAGILPYAQMDQPPARISGVMRTAYCKLDAGTGSTIECYLDNDSFGKEITVHCRLFEGAANLSECAPLLADGDCIDVYYDGSKWRCPYPFIKSEDCP